MRRRMIVSLGPMPTLSLVAAFRSRGWRWPLRAGDVLEVWLQGRLIGTIGTELLEQLIGYHLAGLSIRETLADRLRLTTRSVPPPADPGALLPPMRTPSPPGPTLRGVRGRRLRRSSSPGAPSTSPPP